MKLTTTRLKTGEIIGIVNREKTHLADIKEFGFDFSNMLELIENITPEQFDNLSNLDFSTAKNIHALSNVEFLSPIPNPKHDIICLGVNYADHAAELGNEISDVPVFFGKRAATTSGHLATVDGHLEVDEFLDYEVELAVIIGKQAKKIRADEVEGHIFGYSVFNDLTLRMLQRNHKQWFLGKGTDGFATMGPWIVTKDELPMPFSLNLYSRVNGEVRQSSNTDLMINSITKAISQLSQNITLYPGDIIATGTPEGVGMGFDPPRMLKKGDVVECEVENIGVLKSFIK
jgi:2-keto-4-pentenoate hydratase/2-oxohepta-3-ene-1,7-dioic acid hydratase in catechol pathway